MNSATVLITGGTGSIGRALAVECLAGGASCVRIYSRSEYEQHVMQQEISDERLRFFIGDVADRDRLRRAMDECNIVLHAAGMKRVDSAEYNPDECIKTNVIGAQNVVYLAKECGVKHCIGVSTDKAVNPINVMGATKLLQERIFAAAHTATGHSTCLYASVRLGNVAGSRGSAIDIWQRAIAAHRPIMISDPSMTRYLISKKDAARLIVDAALQAQGGELFVLRMKAATVADMAAAVLRKHDMASDMMRIYSSVPEKKHEQLATPDELCSGRVTVVDPDGCYTVRSDAYADMLSSEQAQRLQVCQIEDMI